ncbi:MAG TPA: hypothetical protein VFP95_06710 [Gammaproteobacteria bacterium]|nr:hypothetical protein [Gammaproteobacteria bacterium]
MNKKLVWLAASVLTLSLAACGGDDGGGGDDTSGGSNANATFTKSNSQSIAGAVLYASQQDKSSLPTGPGGGSSKPFSMPDVTSFETIGVISTKTGTASVVECPDGGTFSIEPLGDGNTSGTPQEGDGIKLTYENCRFEAGADVIDGYVQFEYLKVEGVPYDTSADWLISMEYSYDFSVTATDGSVESQAGSFVWTASYDKSSDEISYSYSNLSYTAPDGGTIVWQEDYSYDSTVSGNGDIEFSINGSAEYEGISGTITIETTEAFVLTDDGRFLAGEMLITNSIDGSSIRISADGNGDLLIEVDSDGDGNYDVSITVSYQSLFSDG